MPKISGKEFRNIKKQLNIALRDQSKISRKVEKDFVNKARSAKIYESHGDKMKELMKNPEVNKAVRALSAGRAALNAGPKAFTNKRGLEAQERMLYTNNALKSNVEELTKKLYQ